MSTEQQSPQRDPVWGAAPKPPTRPRWSGRKTIAAVAIAVGVAGAGGTAVYAATGNDSGNSGPGGPGVGAPGGHGGPGGMGRGGPAFGRELAEALHGEFVVPNGSGGYTTELVQTGKITAISPTSLTVASSDGFTQSYTIDASTVAARGRLSDLVKGDTVAVVATKSGTTATATSLFEGGHRGGFGPHRDGRDDHDAAPPTR